MKVAARVVFHFGEQLPISGVIPPGGRAVASGTPAAVRYQLSPGQPEPDRPPSLGVKGLVCADPKGILALPARTGVPGLPSEAHEGV